MSARYQKNAIISGYIDFLCLVCQEYMKSERDVNTHINKPIHEKRLNSAEVVGNCKNDKIIKVQKGYYCVFCNQLISMASKIDFHVSEKSNNNRGHQLLKRTGDFIVAFDSLLIKERAWCGLLGNCSKVEFGSNYQIYRRIDNTSFYCITCNDLYSMCTFSNHSENDTHKYSIKIGLYAYTNLNKNIHQDSANLFDTKLSGRRKENFNNCYGVDLRPETSIEYFSNKTDDLENKHKIMKSIQDFKRNSVEIDFEYEVACCMKCINYIEYDYEKHPLEKQRVNVVKNEMENNSIIVGNDNDLVDNKSSLLDSVAYFTENYFNLDFISEIAFCRRCGESVELNSDVVMSHIEKHNISHKERNLSRVPYQCEVDMTKSLSVEENSLSSTVLKSKRVGIPEEVKEPDLFNSGQASDTKSEESGDKSSSCNDPAEFARKNKLTFNTKNDNAYCRVCEKRLPSSLPSMKEHVRGRSHQKNVATTLNPPKNPRKSFAKCTLNRFIKEEISIIQFLYKEKILNGKFCISENSYNCITERSCSPRCHLCEVNVMQHEIATHVDDYTHKLAMSNTFVLKDWDSEFVREIRPDLYHCGFCNFVSVDLENLQQHFNSIEHNYNKYKSDSKILIYGPRIHEMRRRHIFQMYMGVQF
ncbi:hypothetical protein ACJJTC_014103 [Scirpophaga incertulas]